MLCVVCVCHWQSASSFRNSIKKSSAAHKEMNWSNFARRRHPTSLNTRSICILIAHWICLFGERAQWIKSWPKHICQLAEIILWRFRNQMLYSKKSNSVFFFLRFTIAWCVPARDKFNRQRFWCQLIKCFLVENGTINTNASGSDLFRFFNLISNTIKNRRT